MDAKKNEEIGSIYEIMNLYLDITIKLINSLQRDDYDNLGELINERQKLIEVMGTISYSKEEFKEVCNKLEIVMVQHSLVNLMNEKMDFLRKEIQELSISKNVNKQYKKSFQVDSLFFNKKI